MAGKSYDELAQKQNELIRKMTDGSVLLAPFSAVPILNLTDPEDSLLTDIPDDYGDLGWLSTDGAQFSNETETSDVQSWGAVEPTRSDIISDITTLALTAQETNLRTLGLYTGADLAAITAAANGEVIIDKPSRPTSRYYRVLALGVDLTEDGEIYIGRMLPRARVTAKDQQNMAGGDDPLGWPVTITGYQDSDLGFSERRFFGGPGWLALLDKMNIPPASAPAPS
ncbi:phage tail tube protein [Nocardiopsis terrae]